MPPSPTPGARLLPCGCSPGDTQTYENGVVLLPARRGRDVEQTPRKRSQITSNRADEVPGFICFIVFIFFCFCFIDASMLDRDEYDDLGRILREQLQGESNARRCALRCQQKPSITLSLSLSYISTRKTAANDFAGGHWPGRFYLC